MMRKNSIFAYILLAAIILIASYFQPLTAKAEQPTFKSDYFTATLSANQSVETQEVKGILNITMKNGWHTYWRVSGDSGLPPVFSWADSQNVETVDITWPVPKRKKENVFYTFGFDEHMPLLLDVKPQDIGRPAKLELNAQIMICKDICIPQKFELSAEVGAAENNPKSPQNVVYAKGERTDALHIQSVVAGKEKLVVNVISQDGFENFEIFPVIEEERLGLATPPEIEISEHDPQKATIKILAPGHVENLARFLDGKNLSIVIIQDETAIEQQITY